MMSNNTFYSYGDFIKARNTFRSVSYDGINRFDAPTALYYKLLFYFSDESGLLGLDGINGFDTNILDNKILEKTKIEGTNTEEYSYKPQSSNLRLKNTAYNYLLLNDELERAEMLKNFLVLLSEINANSPWYFQEISGLDSALDRKLFTENEMKVEEKPNQFTIKCLHDAFDDRIGTLLDLYRASCFSYQNKKEIVPRNLRKFNMGILLFSAPILNRNRKEFITKGQNGTSDNGSPFNIPIFIPDKIYTSYIPSAKLIEFRNCEFDYNSSKSAFNVLNTIEDPFSPQYTITINFDDCYESRYNEIMQEVVTDFINIDLSKERSNDLLEVKAHGDSSRINTNKNDLLIYKKNKDDQYIRDKKALTDTNADQPITGEYEPSATNFKGTFYTTEHEKPWDPFSNGGFFATQLDKINEKVSDLIELPKMKKTPTIHDNGTINRYGVFEYLNRMTGSNGILGTVTQQAAGLAVAPVKDQLAKLYLGNLYEWSVSNILDISKRALSGDVTGTLGMVESKKSITNNVSLKPKDELWEDPKQREFSTPTTEEIWEDPQQRLYNSPETEEIWTDPQQRPHNPPETTEIWSDPQQRGFRPPFTTEIWSDPQQRPHNPPETEELWSDPQQRPYNPPETTKIPGYTQKRSNLFGRINKSKSLRNNL